MPTIKINRIETVDQSLTPGLCDLLMDGVRDGAVGFLHPLRRQVAEAYWQGVFAALGTDTVLWVAQIDGEIAGSVQLALCQKENGKHRGEVQKLIVSSKHRGRGIASKLLDRLEGFAKSHGRTLLFLDTQAGWHADKVYSHLGWQRVGEIPDFALNPSGVLQATAIYFKRL